jgi:glycerol-1-phosphate dehydrogenase [NAD(P)+]
MPIAVGSGVLNDLVKFGASEAGSAYVSVATAASMDGYAASGAALLDDGFKRTLSCPPPVAVVADVDVVRNAPAGMAAWGFGDLAGKAVAGADWLLADALGVEPVNPEPFAMVQSQLGRWLAGGEQLAAREPQAFEHLVRGLIASGHAMQLHGNSRPASGSDHQFSHLWEMENRQVGGISVAHGACVGVGTVAMLALYDWLLERSDDEIALAAGRAAGRPVPYEDEVRAAFDRQEVTTAAMQEMAAKRAAGSPAARAQCFVQVWPDLRRQLLEREFTAAGMTRSLAAAGAARHPVDIGIPLSKLQADYRRARLIRRRYTLLDLLEDLGWLDDAVAHLFSPAGFWGRVPS